MVAAADEAVADLLRKRGWAVLTKGWPDLMCWNRNDGSVMAVEIKRGSDQMRAEQTQMQNLFTSILGVPFHIARDGDIARLQKRGGKFFEPGQSPTKLLRRVDALAAALERNQQEFAKLQAELESVTAVFEPVESQLPPDQAANLLRIRADDIQVAAGKRQSDHFDLLIGGLFGTRPGGAA